MAQPLLDFLVGRARQALPYMRALAARGTQPGIALEILKEFELGFQRQQFLDVYAALRNKADLNRYLRVVPANVTLPPESHAIAVTELTSAGRPVNFQYTLELENEPLEAPEFITVSSQVPLSQNQILALGVGVLSDPSKYPFSTDQLGKIQLSIAQAEVSQTTRGL